MNLEEKDKLKAIAKEYNLRPFFFRQKYSEGFRFVAWSSMLRQLKALVYDILKIFSGDIEILLKIRIQKEGEVDWDRYHGQIEHWKLAEVIKNNELYVFQDGEHQLCIRDSDTGEYIALDDHDILFIYSESEQVIHICEKNGFENREEKLISDFGHWHYSPKDSSALGEKFINDLSLEPVEM